MSGKCNVCGKTGCVEAAHGRAPVFVLGKLAGENGPPHITIEQATNRLAAEVDADASTAGRALAHLSRTLVDMRRERDYALVDIEELEDEADDLRDKELAAYRQRDTALADARRLRAEVDALRVSLGEPLPGVEPAGCPTPGACSGAAAVKAALQERDESREALRGLEQAEACYRRMHDAHGAASIEAGRAWDRMRWAGEEARRVLGEEET